MVGRWSGFGSGLLFLVSFSAWGAGFPSALPWAQAMPLCDSTGHLDAQAEHAVTDSLKGYIQFSLDKKHPRDRGSTQPIFDGNYDWHSSIHAHWALMSMARLSGDSELAEAMKSRPSEAELVLLKNQLSRSKFSDFEIPYGQVWMMVLAKEVARWQYADSGTIQELRVELENRLGDYLEKAKVNTSGLHDSWLFAYYLYRSSATGADPGHLERLRAKWAKAAPKLRTPWIGLWDFLYFPALFNLIQQDGQNSEYSQAWQVNFDRHFSVREMGHHVGRSVMMAWPYSRILRARGSDLRACERVSGSVNHLLTFDPLWKDTDSAYIGVVHWVPQFIWIALYLAHDDF